MSDTQLHARAVTRRIIIVAVLLFALSGGLFYYRFSTEANVNNYESAKRQEASLQQQVESLSSMNATLSSTIEQTGLELVSFSEDKIRYINLASSLALENNVRIGKLTVSDVWDEGEMAGMTTTIQVTGSLTDIKNFVNAYCGSGSTNRINVISLRGVDRYIWLERDVDGNDILTWTDLTGEDTIWEQYLRELEQERREAAVNAGLESIDISLGEEQEEDKDLPITLDRLFSAGDFSIYLEIDFLGRN